MSSDKQATVLSVGRMYCDLIFTNVSRLPSLGTEVFADGLSVHAGGGAYITAAHLSALGRPSALAAMLPGAPYLDLIREDIRQTGVDTSLCKALAPQDGPQLTVSVALNGDRAFLTRRAGPAFPTLSEEAIRSMNVGHIHIGELATLVAHPEILDLSDALNATVSLDCGWDETLRMDEIRPFVGLVDVFLPNEIEYRELRQMGLSENFSPLVVIKRGAAGASAIQGSETFTAATEAIRAIDTTGAGDAFNAGFLAAWLDHQPIPDCLHAGNQRGALNVSRAGGCTTTEPALAPLA